ncbi:hypothetical protein OG792_14715 [Micromonospora sp. NBC_01699]|uniref:hypothetical protein n=1 Tax=Micromonospora sp. NBC_01699 TaxID=2975984 RepID=UPI002E3568D0|nr:hypothetical protein [Micromonospora sp. NBC_01699]
MKQIDALAGTATSGSPRNVAPASTDPSAIGVVLTEFTALRNEIDNLASAHRTMINLNLTVVVAVIGLVLANRVDQHLLLALPLASAAIGLVYQWYVLHAKNIGDYIDQTLRPLLAEYTNDDRVLAWEHQLRTTVYRRRGSAIAGQLSYILLFPSVPVVSLVATVHILDTPWYWVAWCTGVVLSVAQLTIWWVQARHWVCWT